MKPYYSENGITIFLGDCREILPSLGRFDLLLTDPPYGLGERLNGSSGEWSVHFESAPDWDKAVLEPAALQAAIDQSDEAIVWGGNYYPLKPMRCWLSWDKMQEHTSGHFELAWTTLDMPTRVYRLSRVEAYSRMVKVHATQKPVGLMQWCLGFVPGASTVLDICMGSGTTLLAARLEGRQATGIEINERYCEAAAKRLSQGVFEFA